MSGVSPVNPKVQFLSNLGVPLANGTLTTYQAGTSTPATTWQDAALSVANTNPVTLDTRGECLLWLNPTQTYKFVLADSSGIVQWTVDNISGAVAGSYTASLAASSGSSLVGFLQAGTGAVARTSQDKLREWMTLEDFGAKGDGVTDDTAAIQAAINAAFGVAKLWASAGKNYLISSTLQIGNGSSAAPSNQNGLWFVGLGSGASSSEVNSAGAAVKFTWNGAIGGTMMSVNGPIYGLKIGGFLLDCAGKAAKGVEYSHPINSRFDDILSINYTGACYSVDAYLAPTGCVIGASGNIFSNIHAKKPATGGSGMVVGSATAVTGQLDVARNTFINCDWWRDGTTSTTYGVALQFCDNNTFVECHTYGQGGTSGVGLYVNPPSGDTTFPKEVLFLNCPIEGGANSPSTWTTTRGIGFFPYPTGDGEPVPSTPTAGQYYGFTDKGEQIGGVVVSPGSTRITSHTSTTASLTFGAIANQGSSEQSVTVSGAALGDIVIVSTNFSPLPAGCVLTGFVNGAGSVAVRWVNASSVSATPNGGSAATYRIDLWKH